MITSTTAAALERMIKPDPVTNFVGDGFALVVVLSTATWDRREEEDDTIVFLCRGVVGREGGVAEEALA